MKSLCCFCKTVTILLGAMAGFLTAFEVSTHAQVMNPRPTTVERRGIERQRRQRELDERERLSRELLLKRPEDPPNEQRNAKTIALQVKQDFAGLQLYYNRIVLAMASNEKLNRDSVLEDVANIKRHSTRLKSNLALPRPEANEEKVVLTNDEPIESSLLTLRKYIYDFVTSPLFDPPAAYRIHEARKAGSDLEKVVQLSESIGKSNKPSRENR